MWARIDYIVDQPSVEPEGSSKMGLGRTADDRIWGRNVDREEGGYLATWVSLALGKSCYSDYAT
jgi:hypothetical protein